MEEVSCDKCGSRQAQSQERTQNGEKRMETTTIEW